MYTPEQKVHIQFNLNCISKRVLYKRFDKMLDDRYTVVNFGDFEYDSSYVFKNVDKTAYNESFNNWLDGEIGVTLTDEINGEYFDLDEVSTLLEEMNNQTKENLI